jgi:bidirectional [NiFe] hydrogenase diaphorase subunit
MRRHGHQPNALIETLHTVQESFGYLDEKALHYVSQALRVPLSQVYGVATFYHFFTLKPPGEHTCVICMGTACYIKGGATILSAIEEKYRVKAGETTSDGKFSLLTARCVGACGIAPAAVFDGRIVGKLDRSEALNHIQEWMQS